ncbi:MAG: alpha-amylase family glycosyl hydrolase [Bacilli bacterium]
MNNNLKTYTIYQVYVRNFTKEGTLKALINKLGYIKDLGAKIIQLLPINEIGMDGRKGTLGSPYAIKDYYKINHELGTLDDFKELIKKAHEMDLLIMMDVVFNHTSRDCILIKEHPEFYYRDKDGNLANRFGDWSDVYDLNYTNNLPLFDYVTKILEYYTNLGVDGYRFDVASLLPNDFYKYAIPKIRKINKDLILLGEAIEPGFATSIRQNCGNADSDSELYEDGFDLLYRYSNYGFLREYLHTHQTSYLELYKVGIYLENVTLPTTALKIGTIENHDCERICSYTNYDPLRMNIIAYSFFLKGTGFVYCGQESKEYKLPSLFEKDLISTKVFDTNYYNFIKKLIELKSNKENLDLIQTNVLKIIGKAIGLINIYKNHEPIIGLFNFDVNPIVIKLKDLKDGAYLNIINNERVVIHNNSIKVNGPLYLKKLNDDISR